MSGRAPVVAIVGRPNVGKSTLLNRIVGRREAIVEARPGVTRDRKTVDAEWAGRAFRLVDTGGWTVGGDELDELVSAQSERAVADADLVLFVVDSTVGLTDEDDRVGQLLQRSEVPVLVVANKVDDRSHELAIWELMGLGLGEPYPVSALHGRGTGDLLDAVVERLQHDEDGRGPCAGSNETNRDIGGVGTEDPSEPSFSVTIVGRPNVGKSTLFNRITGADRSVVHDRPGTTRDSIDTVVETDQGSIRFVDTAGMRRRARIDEKTEYYSLVRALRAVDAADVALLVVDSTVGVTHQDQRLAERIDAAGCPIVVVLNKWDQLDEEARRAVGAAVTDRLSFLGEPAVLRTSALTGKGVQRLWPSLEEAIGSYRTRIATRDVNREIRAAQAAHPAPGGARVLYATQGATDPPTFTLFSNRELPRTYLRYLERRLREAFNLGSTPLKLRVRRRSD